MTDYEVYCAVFIKRIVLYIKWASPLPRLCFIIFHVFYFSLFVCVSLLPSKQTVNSFVSCVHFVQAATFRHSMMK